MPEISDEELNNIQNGIKKAVETEKRSQRLIASIGSAIMGLLQPALDKIADSIKSITPEIKKAVAEVKVSAAPPAPAARRAAPAKAAPAAEAAAPASAASAAPAAKAAPPARAAKAAPAAPPSKVTVNVPKNTDLIKEIRQMAKAISEQKTPFMPSKMEVNFSKPQSVVVTDALGKPMLGPMGGGGGGGGPSNVHIKEIFGSAGASVITPDGRLKTELASGGGGLTDTEFRASAVEVRQVSGSSDSVVVNSQVPGTGATNLGKAIDDPVGSTDTGVMVLGVHDAEASKVTPAEEDFDHLHIGELGGLSVEPEQHNHLDEMDSTSGWTVLGNDTINLNTTSNHLTGSNALTFDKTDGDANTVIAGIQKTITTLDMGELDLHDIVQTACFVSSVSLISYVFIRIGTSSSNYNEWRVEDTQLTANEWIVLGVPIGNASNTGATGTGVDWGAIAYIAVGVAFDGETNALSGILFDQLGIFTNSHSTASLSSEVSTTISTAKVDLQKINGSTVDKGAGNASNGSQRVVIATDDVNQAAIKSAVEIMDDWDETNRAAVNPISSVTGIAGGTGADATNVTRVSLATNIALPAGTNNIGDVDIASGTVTAVTDITNSVSVATLPETQQVQLNDVKVATEATQAAVEIMDDWDNTASDGASVSGDVAHDGIDAGEPVKVGMKAVASKADPTEVAANDRTDWLASVAGVPWVIGGHPNVLNASINISDADGAQTDTAIITVAANLSIVVTMIQVYVDEDTTAGTQVRVGFGTANTPALDAAGVIMSRSGIPPGGGAVAGTGAGIVGQGASNSGCE